MYCLSTEMIYKKFLIHTLIYFLMCMSFIWKVNKLIMLNFHPSTMISSECQYLDWSFMYSSGILCSEMPQLSSWYSGWKCALDDASWVSWLDCHVFRPKLATCMCFQRWGETEERFLQNLFCLLRSSEPKG